MEERDTHAEECPDVVSVKEPEEKPSMWYHITHMGLLWEGFFDLCRFLSPELNFITLGWRYLRIFTCDI